MFRGGGRVIRPGVCRRVVSLALLHIASLHPGVWMGTGDHNACDGLASHPGEGGGGGSSIPSRFILRNQL